ncbi:MAG: S-layer domain-containing protein [Candidatus Peregrinibacteria bacterium Greene0416_19]|nr:MAG: S-layer domain-containing protein [Candidatus Peregrinibacteria bacterium Greene0416_19]
MWKRLTAGLLCACFVASINPVLAASFQDVHQTRYEDAYTYLSLKGAVKGYSDGTGRPFFLLNRVEALKVLLDLSPRHRPRVQYYQEHPSRLPLFTDADQSAWYVPYLEAAFEAGIVTGYRDRTFKPGNPLKTEEAIVLIMRVYGEDVRRDSEGPDGWFRSDVERAIGRNIVASEEALYLGDTINRGQFFDMVYRMDEAKTQNLTAFIDADGTVKRHAPLVRRPLPVVTVPNGNVGASFSLSIPALGIEGLPVNHPADSFTSKGLLAPLKYGVGHLFSYPGGGGKIMIYGHSSGYAWDSSKYTKIFRRVNELKPGDKVYVAYNGMQRVYEVQYHEQIAPTDTRPFTGRGEELILYTCWPPDSIAKRWIVHARPMSEIVASQ